MAVRAAYAPLEGTSALDMRGARQDFTFVRGGRVEDAASSFEDDLRIAFEASGLSDMATSFTHGASCGSDDFRLGARAYACLGIVSFAVSLFLLML